MPEEIPKMMIVVFLRAIMLFSVVLCICGCPEMIGAVAGGFYGGMTGATLEESLAVADDVTRNIKDNQAQQAQIEAQKRQEVELLAKLPAEWRQDGSDLFQDDNGNWNYVHPDKQTWYKLVGKTWTDPNAGTDVAAAPAPTKRPALASAPGEKRVIKTAEASKAKLDQGLRGRLWPNEDQTVWYLENSQGTFKLTNGAFVAIPR